MAYKLLGVKLVSLISSHSNHSPILLQNSPIILNGRNYSFRFENNWLKEEDINAVVVDAWGGEPGADIIRKTGSCAEKLKWWGRRKRMRFKQEVAECSEEMERL
jgi:hypothetical protein